MGNLAGRSKHPSHLLGAPRPAVWNASETYRWFRRSWSGMATSAVLLGVAMGFGVDIFLWLINLFSIIFSGHADYSAANDAGQFSWPWNNAAHPWFPWLGPYFVVFAPIIAGLIYGPLIHFFAQEARGYGVPEVMYTVAKGSGRIRPRVAIVKMLASALTIGGGGSVGRVGPAVQIGSALGSATAQLLKTGQQRTNVLLACGAAGGLAATFHAPLTGVFFALEVILASFALSSFGLVVLTAATATAVAYLNVPANSVLVLPSVQVTDLRQYLLFAVVGIGGGALGVFFSMSLSKVSDIADSLWKGPEWLRPAAGGVFLGVILLFVPQMYGLGFPILHNALYTRYALLVLLLLLAAKIIATSVTIGIGGSGGIFAPALLIGGFFGSAAGLVLESMIPGIAGPASAYALIGMIAVFSGAARAPITGVVMLVEITNRSIMVLPLLVAVVLAAIVPRILGVQSIYTMKLIRRGVDMSKQPSRLELVQAAAIMEPLPEPVPHNMSLHDALQALSAEDAHAHGVLPVMNDQGAYSGVITTDALAYALAEGAKETDPVSVASVFPEELGADATLKQVSRLFDEGAKVIFIHGEGEEEAQIVGWVTPHAVVTHLV